MTNDKTGGPAFPRPMGQSRNADNLPLYDSGNKGMTLRDYFAAKAMQSLLVADGTTHFAQRAKEAYDMADAMLEARK